MSDVPKADSSSAEEKKESSAAVPASALESARARALAAARSRPAPAKRSSRSRSRRRSPASRSRSPRSRSRSRDRYRDRGYRSGGSRSPPRRGARSRTPPGAGSRFNDRFNGGGRQGPPRGRSPLPPRSRDRSPPRGGGAPAAATGGQKRRRSYSRSPSPRRRRSRSRSYSRSRSRSPRRGGGGGRSRSRSRSPAGGGKRSRWGDNKAASAAPSGPPPKLLLGVSTGEEAYARRVAASSGRAYNENNNSGGGSSSAPRPNPYANEPLPPLFSIHKGVINRLQPYGAFVALDGFRKHGLLSIGRILDTRVERIEDAIKEGQRVFVKVVQTEPAAGKMSLSMRDVDQETGRDLNPAESVGMPPSAASMGRGGGGGGGGFGGPPQDLPPLHSIVSVRVVKIQPFGAFCEILDASGSAPAAGRRSAQGLIHISQLSAARRVENVEDVVSVGDSLRVKVVKIEAGKIGLSLKDVDQATGRDLDPSNSNKQGGGGGGGDGARGGGSNDVPSLNSIHRGKIVKIQDFGAFVEMAGFRKHGLVHISQLASFKVDSVDKAVALGEAVWVKVNKLEGDKIGLSMKSVNQQTGADLDPQHINSAAEDARSQRNANFEGSRHGGPGGPIELGAVHNASCQRCGAVGHLTIDCLAPVGVRYDAASDRAEEARASAASAASDRESAAAASAKSAILIKIAEAQRIIAEAKAAKAARKEKKREKKARKEAKKTSKKSSHKKHSSSSSKKSSRRSRSRSNSASSSSSDGSR